MEADVARACDLPQKRRTTGHEIEAKYGTYREALVVLTFTSLSKRAHCGEEGGLLQVDDVRFASVSLDTDIDIPHMRTPPARIAAAAPAT